MNANRNSRAFSRVRSLFLPAIFAYPASFRPESHDTIPRAAYNCYVLFASSDSKTHLIDMTA